MDIWETRALGQKFEVALIVTTEYTFTIEKLLQKRLIAVG